MIIAFWQESDRRSAKATLCLALYIQKNSQAFKCQIYIHPSVQPWCFRQLKIRHKAFSGQTATREVMLDIWYCKIQDSEVHLEQAYQTDLTTVHCIGTLFSTSSYSFRNIIQTALSTTKDVTRQNVILNALHNPWALGLHLFPLRERSTWSKPSWCARVALWRVHFTTLFRFPALR